MRTFIPVFIAITLLPLASVGAELLFEIDFDDERRLGDLLRANGKITLSAGDGPSGDGSNQQIAGADGRALRMNSTGDFAFFTAPGIVKADFDKADTIALRVYNGEGEIQRLDFLGIERDKKAILWRKVEFSHTGWAKIELPMKWFRWNKGRGPDWRNITSLGIRGGEGLDLWIDGIEILDVDPENGPLLTPGDLTGTFFADSADVQMKTDDGVWVITNSADLKVNELHTHLTGVRDQLLNDFPSWKDTQNTTPPIMVVARDKAAYREMFARLGENYLATMPVSESGGYHVQGIGFSYFDPAQGSKRPVFTHEFTHSVASSIGRIDYAGRDWFQEGLASLIQIRTHPQTGIGMIILSGVRNEDAHESLAELTNGKPISSRRYWQALTVFDFLKNSPEMKPKFPALIEAIQKTGTTNLSVHLEPVYGLTFEELEQKWKAFVTENLDRYDSKIKPKL